jgi:tellurite resistance protein
METQTQALNNLITLDHVTSNEVAVTQLSEEQKAKAMTIAKTIDEKDLNTIINFGAETQQQVSDFANQMIANVKNKDTGSIGDSLNELLINLNELKPNALVAKDSNIFLRIFGNIRKSIQLAQMRFQEVGEQVDKISIKLATDKDGLLHDNAALEELYKRNKSFFDELNVYIGAGEMKIEELQQKLIPEAMQKAQETGDQMDVQVVNDLHQFLDRLEKRNHDLKLTRQMTIQQAPQIRLIQNTNQTLAEKIQSSITTTIPLWKNQIAIAMTLLRQKDAVTAQRQVSETTNQLIQKNSEMLKISTIETARENERGIIDLETLQKTQQNLIETLEETLQIQQEGRMRRKAAEIELNRLEGTMQQQLLQLSDKEKALRNG